MKKTKKTRRKMPPWLVVVLYFGCIALIIGGMYGIYRFVGGSENKPAEKPKTVTVEEADGTRKNVVSGEEAYDKDGYTLDENGERVVDENGNYSNILAFWAQTFLKADVDPNDFGVDDEGYCYRPSTGERYKTPDGREFTDMDAYNGGFSDKTEEKK